MGFEHYDDEGLARVVEAWRDRSTEPGSLGDRAKRDSLAEWERRKAAQGHTGPDPGEPGANPRKPENP